MHAVAARLHGCNCSNKPPHCSRSALQPLPSQSSTPSGAPPEEGAEGGGREVPGAAGAAGAHTFCRACCRTHCFLLQLAPAAACMPAWECLRCSAQRPLTPRPPLPPLRTHRSSSAPTTTCGSSTTCPRMLMRHRRSWQRRRWVLGHHARVLISVVLPLAAAAADAAAACMLHFQTGPNSHAFVFATPG